MNERPGRIRLITQILMAHRFDSRTGACSCKWELESDSEAAHARHVAAVIVDHDH